MLHSAYRPEKAIQESPRVPAEPEVALLHATESLTVCRTIERREPSFSWLFFVGSCSIWAFTTILFILIDIFHMSFNGLTYCCTRDWKIGQNRLSKRG